MVRSVIHGGWGASGHARTCSVYDENSRTVEYHPRQVRMRPRPRLAQAGNNNQRLASLAGAAAAEARGELIDLSNINDDGEIDANGDRTRRRRRPRMARRIRSTEAGIRPPRGPAPDWTVHRRLWEFLLRPNEAIQDMVTVMRRSLQQRVGE